MNSINRIGMGVGLGAAALLLSACGASTKASSPGGNSAKAHKTSGYVVGYSMAYSVNSFVSEMDSDFTQTAKSLEKSGQLKNTVMLNANDSVSQQVSQIDDLILKHVNGIVIDPVSSTALNGAIAKAVHAGIKVVVINNGPVTSSLPYQINFNTTKLATTEAQYAVKQLHGKGNIFIERGVAGNATDVDFYNGFTSVLKKYPHIKNVGSVYANWTETTSQSKVGGVLPSLPKVNAVLGEGGEAYGAIQAFKAAGDPVPLMILGNRGQSIHWWLQHPGYKTISASTNPGIASASLYVMMDILKGQHAPKNMTMPFLEITSKTLSNYKSVPQNGVAQKVYSSAWVTAHLLH